MEKEELRIREVDRVAVQRLIDREYDSLAGVILRLAWQLGLTRQEIHRLKWSQFSADFSNAMVDGRTIPIESSVGLFFDSLSDNALADEVVVSPVTKAPVSEQYISMLATKELRSIGLDDIKLSDLRSDYVLQQMERYPLDYVAQVSNLQMVTLQAVYLPFLQAQQKDAIPAGDTPIIEEEQIESIISEERGSTIGLILDLVWSTEIPVGAVSTLQWRQVNLKTGNIIVEGRTCPIPKCTKKQLQELQRSYRPMSKNQNVFLSARSRKPMDAAYVSKMARELFVRNNLHGITLAQLQVLKRKDSREEDVDLVRPAILGLIERQGYSDKSNVAEALGVDMQTAHSWLVKIEAQGHLKRYGVRYYAKQDGHWSEGYQERIYNYIIEHPNCTRTDIESALGAPPRSAQPHLAQLVLDRKVHRDGRKYRED